MEGTAYWVCGFIVGYILGAICSTKWQSSGCVCARRAAAPGDCTAPKTSGDAEVGGARSVGTPLQLTAEEDENDAVGPTAPAVAIKIHACWSGVHAGNGNGDEEGAAGSDATSAGSDATSAASHRISAKRATPARGGACSAVTVRAGQVRVRVAMLCFIASPFPLPPFIIAVM